MLKYLFRVCVILLVISQMTVSRAQVFNPPTAQPEAGVQQAGVQQAGVQQAGGPATVAQTSAVEQTGWGIPLPKITMPKITMPKVTMPSMETVTGPFKSGFGKVSSGTKKAWEGTKEMFSVGQNKTATTTRRSAKTQEKPSFWHRLLVRESEPRAPQTVGEFMRQKRLDP